MLAERDSARDEENTGKQDHKNQSIASAQGATTLRFQIKPNYHHHPF